MNVVCKGIKCGMDEYVCNEIHDNKIKFCHLDKRKYMYRYDLLSNEKKFQYTYNYSKSFVETILYQLLHDATNNTDYIH